MQCPICNEKLTIDEVEFRFSGNKNIQAYCTHCMNNFYIYIRYHKIWKYEYRKLIKDKEFGLIEDERLPVKTVYPERK